MGVKNGIIIDGVLHELVITRRSNCYKCSLYNLCHNDFKYACLCWINLGLDSEVAEVEFKCRGKVTDIKTEE